MRARWEQIADQIRQVGVTAVGSVLQVYNVCGTAACRCHTDPARRHGLAMVRATGARARILTITVCSEPCAGS